MKSIIVVCLMVLMSFPLQANIYYVDYKSGNNEADGLSPTNAWKHCPGDKKATDIPKKHVLKPGDTVKFKGGVQYYGEISVRFSGSKEAPITFDGNSDGSYGTGKAIMDGAKIIENWKKVPNSEFVQGNSRWKSIIYADIKKSLISNFSQKEFVVHRDKKPTKQAPWQRLILIDGEKRVLPIAQYPKPKDDFYPDIPEDFFETEKQLKNNYPHKIYYEKGSKGNSSLPLLPITYGGVAPVLQPSNGGTISVELNKAKKISEIGVTLFRPKSFFVPDSLIFLVDDKEVFEVKLDKENHEMQRFKLPKEIESKKISFKLKHTELKAPSWMKLQQIAVFDKKGSNLLEHDVQSVLVDKKRITKGNLQWFKSLFIGVHGGNNHVYFAKVHEIDFDHHRILMPYFYSKLYDKTKYAFYNSPLFMNNPGEWCLEALNKTTTRVYLLPDTLKDGLPSNIGYAVLKTAFTINPEVSHVNISGFLMQRYAGGYGGVAVRGKQRKQSSHIHISDCEVRFISADAGVSLNYCHDVIVENCFIHHCPGWTVGIYVNRVKNFSVKNNKIYKNSGSGVRHYDSKNGKLSDNHILSHYGMHSSGVNFYEGCSDISFENNYVHNVVTMNRSAENFVFRNNVIDSENAKNSVSFAMWSSGKTGGTHIKNVLIENNTFINNDKKSSWSQSIFIQSGKSYPEDVVVRNNILDVFKGLRKGSEKDNLILHDFDEEGNKVLNKDLNKLFINVKKGDYRLKDKGLNKKLGSTLEPPVME